MILTNTVSGPRFSTDSVSADLARFLSRPAAVVASADRSNVASTGFPASIEALYPSLFEVRRPSAVDALRTAVVKLGAAVATLRPRHAANGARFSR